MTAPRVPVAVSCIVAAALFSSCQTTPPEPVPSEPQTSFEFRPANYHSRIHIGQGRYSNLYSVQSHAIWVGPDVAELKHQKAVEQGGTVEESLNATAKWVEENYIVIECHIESIFPDASVAYDVVGFRNVDVYLKTPSGLKIMPIQRILGTHADEEQRKALKLFRRTNIVVFPKRDIMVRTPNIDSDAPSVRLILEGFDAEFYFEWLALPPPPEPVSEEPRRWSPTKDEAIRAVKLGFSELFTRLRALERHLK